MKYIALFSGIRELIKADKLCQSAGVPIKVIPIPHQYTTECGMALIIEDCDVDRFKIIVSQNNITVEINDYNL